MTTWLEFRAEPIVEPVIEIKWDQNGEEGKEYTLICHTGECGWWDVVFSPEQVIETKNDHVKWHEDGMPE